MRRLGLAVVRGTSMQPTLHDGDRLLVVHGAEPRIGRMALVRLPDGPQGPRPLAVKRVTMRDPEGGDGWWLESDNAGVGVDSWQVGAIAPEDVTAVVLLRLPSRARPRRASRARPGS